MGQKTIIVDTMLGGMTMTEHGDEPCKSIDDQVQIILKENPNYKYVSLTDIPVKSINMRKAMLIVDVQSDIEEIYTAFLKQKGLDIEFSQFFDEWQQNKNK